MRCSGARSNSGSMANTPPPSNQWAVRQSVVVSISCVSGGRISMPPPIAAYGTDMTVPMRLVNQRDSSADAAIMPSDAEPNPPSNPTANR